MKRGLKVLAIMIVTFILTTNVKAEEITLTQKIDNSLNNKNIINQNSLNYIYKTLIPSKPNFKYLVWYNEDTNLFNIYFYSYISKTTFDISSNYLKIGIEMNKGSQINYECYEGNNWSCSEIETNMNGEILSNIKGNNVPSYTLYDTNDNIINDIQPVELTGFYSDTIVINKGDTFPTLKNLYNYNSWTEYEQNHLENYTEVNLDNYEYVLLSLKNYNQTQAFQTNLQVKGQIGITPIYNYGQTSKDSVTGVQVQDRCNIAYENYTSYPFYILQSDLQNNSIYAVKECSQGSSFKFDNTVFDVAYITTENKDKPTITIGGKTYNVIPYKDLPSTATKNEENNYIPGESGSATDTGGLDSAIKNVQQRMSEIWNTFTYFTDFVGQIFSSLPEEVQTVLLSAFTIAIILGLIKIFIGK